MGILRRIFSADFRRAVAAEAAGDYLDAARSYALCGEVQKVVDMHLALARQSPDPDHRIRELRLALNFCREDDKRRPMVLRLLAKAMGERGLSLGTGTVEGRERVQEAAELHEQGESWEQAGDLFMALSDPTRAAKSYARAGLVERVEEVLGQEERSRERAVREDRCFADYEAALRDGRRDEAAEALRGCIEAAQVPADYRRLLASLEERMLTTGRVGLRVGDRRLDLLGGFPAVLGRDASCELLLRGHSVSRRHLRLRLDESGDRVLLEDLGSRNGTTLDGLPLGGVVPLPGAGQLDLGGDCQVGFKLGDGQGPRVELEVAGGMDLGWRAVIGAGERRLDRLLEGAPRLLVSFVRGLPQARPVEGELLLNGLRVSSAVQLIQGDRLEVDGRQVDVELL